MQMSHLKEFSLLAKTLNFSVTARHFYISQSALSRHITALEAELDAQLFSRDSRNVSLTPAGAAFAKDVDVVLTELEGAILSLGAYKDTEQRNVRVGYLHEPFKKYLEDVYRLLRLHASQLSPQFHTIDYGGLHSALVEKRVDVALISFNDPSLVEFCDIVPIYKEHYDIAVPPGHRLWGVKSAPFEVLKGEPIVYPDHMTMQPFCLDAEKFFSQAGFSPTVSATYYDIPTMFFHVKAGDGVSLCYSCSREFHQDVWFVEIENIDTSSDMVAAWNKDLPVQLASPLKAVFGQLQAQM